MSITIMFDDNRYFKIEQDGGKTVVDTVISWAKANNCLVGDISDRASLGTVVMVREVRKEDLRTHASRTTRASVLRKQKPVTSL